MSFIDVSVRGEGSLDGVDDADSGSHVATPQSRSEPRGLNRPSIAAAAAAAAHDAMHATVTQDTEHVITPHASGAAREASVLRSCLPMDLLFQFEEVSKTRSGRSYSPCASPADGRAHSSPSMVAAAIARGQAPPPPPYPGSGGKGLTGSYRRAMVNSAHVAVQKRSAPRRRVPYPDPVDAVRRNRTTTPRLPAPAALPNYHVRDPRRGTVHSGPAINSDGGVAKDSRTPRLTHAAALPVSATALGRNRQALASPHPTVLSRKNGAAAAGRAVLREHNADTAGSGPASTDERDECGSLSRSISVDVSDETLDFLGLNRSLFARLRLASPRRGVAYLGSPADNMSSDV